VKTKEILKIAKLIMNRHKKLFEKLAKLEQAEKQTK